jgi:hypothetical protein
MKTKFGVYSIYLGGCGVSYKMLIFVFLLLQPNANNNLHYRIYIIAPNNNWNHNGITDLRK